MSTPEERPVCGRCYTETDKLYTASGCPDPKPEVNLGMFHCPGCGAMVLGGIEHPPLCRPCFEGRHPVLDGIPEDTLDDGINYPGSQRELLWIVGCSVVAIVSLVVLLIAGSWGFPW